LKTAAAACAEELPSMTDSDSKPFFLKLYILNLLLLFTKIQNVRPVDGLFSTRIQKIAIYFPLLQQQPW